MTIRAPLFLLVLLAASPASAQSAARTVLPAWLSGCWEGGSAGRVFEERWSPARAGTMVGMGRTIRGDSTAEVELTILRVRGDTLRYEAHPLQQEPAVFSATRSAPAEVVFENPAHDFPQRISYRAVGADSLYARIEGPMRGSWRGIDFPMARVRCEDPG
jgi:hypothetical protein